MCPNWVCVCAGVWYLLAPGITHCLARYHTHQTRSYFYNYTHHADSEVRSGDDDDVRTRYTHSLGQETETE